ncbi:MAG: dihydroneopterin aldolase [Ferruginibacter sp.]|nr:dihydroneopterin aldolase [Ferruginibacter sp.]
MFTIHLHQLDFFGRHGFFDEEEIVGNNFEVSVDIRLDDSISVSELGHTLDYVSAYQVIKNEMGKTEKLLEVLCERICNQIHQKDHRVASVYISIFKKNIPIPACIGKIGVSLTKNFIS